SRTLLGDDAAQMDDAVVHHDAQAERTPVVLREGVDDAVANVVVPAVGSGIWRARLATACNRLARDTMPTISLPRITGKRLTLFFSIICTISSSAVSSVIVSGCGVIIPATLQPCS